MPLEPEPEYKKEEVWKANACERQHYHGFQIRKPIGVFRAFQPPATSLLEGAKSARLSLEAFSFGGVDELPFGVTTLPTLLSQASCEVTSLCITSVIVPFFVSITEEKGN